MGAVSPPVLGAAAAMPREVDASAAWSAVGESHPNRLVGLPASVQAGGAVLDGADGCDCSCSRGRLVGGPDSEVAAWIGGGGAEAAGLATAVAVVTLLGLP